MDDQPEAFVSDPDAHAEVEIVFSARELEMIAEGEASAAQGHYVDGQEMHAWLHSLGTANELPVPPVRQRE